jgi:hypothetical protein
MITANGNKRDEKSAKDRLISLTWGGGGVERHFEAFSLWQRHFGNKGRYQATLKFFKLKYVYQESSWFIEIKLSFCFRTHFRRQSL